MIEFAHGDMFTVPADIRVNTVNCVGAMGAGVALAFKQRYPEMFKEYQRECKDGLIRPGKLHVWRSLAGDWIINFPTKRDWREPSRYEDVRDGLEALRIYLEPLGGVTVALPALGCGNGGLDWKRVSKMIEETLHDLDARVLVFAPPASRQAGRTAASEPTKDELKSAKRLGFSRISEVVASKSGITSSAFFSGNSDLLQHQWIGIFPSEAPSAREQNALRAVAEELANSGKEVCVALVHTARTSEEIAQLFASYGVNVVLLLPFGALTRKIIRQGMPGGGAVTLLSTAPLNTKWNRTLLAQAVNFLRSRASTILLSDPLPNWLVAQSRKNWRGGPAFFLRYDPLPPEIHEALLRIGATPIGRKADRGIPSLDALLSAYYGQRAPSEVLLASAQNTSTQTLSEHERTNLRLHLTDFPLSAWTEVITVLQKGHICDVVLDAKISDPHEAKLLEREIMRLRTH